MTAKKILLVDSMELALKMEEEILRRAGLDILTARSGAEALALIQSEKPDLVLLDKTMPDLPGDEVSRQVKADPNLANIPIILMVGEDNPALIEACYQANCEDVLVKPLDQDVVVGKISNWLQIQTRKHPRLNLDCPVRIEESGQDWVGKAVNVNRRGILVQSERGCSPTTNVRITFSLSAADQPVAVWTRAERQVGPEDARNQSGQTLILFRFLNLADGICTRIDQLATFQEKKQVETAKQVVGSEFFQKLRTFLERPPPFYEDAVRLLADNVMAEVQGVGAKELAVLQTMASSLRTWEKVALSAPKNEDDRTLAKALGLRAKLKMDSKALEPIRGLAESDLPYLSEFQKTYLAEADKLLEKLQTAINDQMAANQLERMKELNQSKTESFKAYVEVKAAINRILNPQAAVQAKTFQADLSQEEAYQVASFQRAKVIEEKPKEAAPKFSKRKEPKGSNPILVAILVLGAFGAIGFAVYNVRFRQPTKPLQKDRMMQTIAEPLKTKAPIVSLRILDTKTALVVLGKPWFTLPVEKRKELAISMSKELMQRGYPETMLVDERTQTLGFLQSGMIVRFKE